MSFPVFICFFLHVPAFFRMLCRFSAEPQVRLWRRPPLPVVVHTAAEVQERSSVSFLPCGCLRSWIGG